MTVAPFIDPQPHEGDVHLIFDEYGLKPYFALDSVRKDYDGWQTTGKPTRKVSWRNQTWHLAYDYDVQPIDPRDHEDYQLQTVPLFRIYFVADDSLYDDEPADQSARTTGGTMTIRPRWPDMTKDGKPVRGIPNLGGPYLDVQIQASNIDHHLYHDLVQTAMEAFGVSRRYFQTPHEMSNVQDLAVYVRLSREHSEAIYAPDGPIARTHSVMTSGMSGYRMHKEDHRKIPGYYVSTHITDERAGDIIRGHRLGKETKHYYPLNPEQFDEDHPLYYPKVEVSLQTSITDETVYWSDLDDVLRELDETLLNYLSWSGLTTRADDEVFESDVHFDAESETRRSRRLVDCPLPEIEDEQEHVVMRIWGDMRTSDRDFTRSLIEDGGKPTREELAERTGWSYRTVRRYVNRCEGIVTDAAGKLEIGSKHMQNMLLSRVRAAAENFETAMEDAVMTAADVAAGRRRSEWSEMKNRYAARVVEHDRRRDEIHVEYRPTDWESRTDMLRDIKRAARDRWTSLRQVTVTYHDHLGGEHTTVLSDLQLTTGNITNLDVRSVREKVESVDWEAWKAGLPQPTEDRDDT
ncbi:MULTISPECIES: winged helix-turn-helix domain-containing protein [unclassified Haloferax]|uniref:winged helix-turn-helix domain-containing protein n=1 Tax=unclassified Haloferax TaxID=2625095 RepID=UPI002873F8C9|nr:MULTISPECIES: winged helix-turn-helix domain-containing protein [unclassified Haloferax]MDS0241802.1 winged helix-turn-helix domain-containing protein [Haloferax sp. S2CR25]MDS0444923.1 winged helix-turn-helix domain-containing protein [Haloferax sp. S2CR25-2]